MAAALATGLTRFSGWSGWSRHVLLQGRDLLPGFSSEDIKFIHMVLNEHANTGDLLIDQRNHKEACYERNDAKGRSHKSRQMS